MKSFQQMEHHLLEADRALVAAGEFGDDAAAVLAPVASAHALLVIAECLLRREMREAP